MILAASPSWLELHGEHLRNITVERSIEQVGSWIEDRVGTEMAELGKRSCYLACFRGTFGRPTDAAGVIKPLPLTIPRDIRIQEPVPFQISTGEYHLIPIFEQLADSVRINNFQGRTYLIFYLLMHG